MKNYLLFFFVLICSSILAQENVKKLPELGEERIIFYDQHLEVHNTGVIRAFDRLAVYSKGDKIKNGIIKELMVYQDSSFQDNNVEIISTRIDGKPSYYELKDIKQDGKDYGLYLYVRDSEHKLEPGFHTFEFVYDLIPNIEVVNNVERLHWRVINEDPKLEGLNIDFLETSIAFYEGIQYINYNCITKSSCQTQTYPELTFYSQIKNGETFEFDIDVPKGTFQSVNKRSFFEKSMFYLITGAFILFCLLFLVWTHRTRIKRLKTRFNKDEVSKLPPDVSPALASYIMNGKKITSDTFLAACTNLGTKGYVKFNYNEDKSYTLNKLHDDMTSLPESERSLMTTLFRNGNEFTFIDNKKTNLLHVLKDFNQAIRGELDHAMDKSKLYYVLTIPTILFFIYVVYATVFDTLSFGPLVGENSIKYLVILSLAMLVFIISPSAFLYRDDRMFQRYWALGPAVFILLMFILTPFLSDNVNSSKTLVFVSVVCFFIFSTLLLFVAINKVCRTPTILKTKLESLKSYLSSGSLGERLNHRNFETYLPYAAGMGVDDVFNKEFTEKYLKKNKIDYRQTWFTSSNGGNEILTTEIRPHLVNAITKI